MTQRTPLAPAMWPASAPSPSETSIIALAPERASARPASIRARGRSWRSIRASACRRVDRGQRLGFEQEQSRGRPADRPGQDQHVARPGAGPRDVTRLRGRCPTTVIARKRTGEPTTSPPATATPSRERRGAEAVGDAAELVLGDVLGNSQLHVRLARLGTHRRQVRERDRERLVPDRLGRRGRAPEMDAVHDRVDGGDVGPAGLDDRRVVAAPDDHVIAVGRPGRRDALPKERDQIELTEHDGEGSRRGGSA